MAEKKKPNTPLYAYGYLEINAEDQFNLDLSEVFHMVDIYIDQDNLLWSNYYHGHTNLNQAIS